MGADEQAGAPPDLAVVLAFVNTVDLESGRDELTTAHALKGWFAHHGLWRPERAPADAQSLARALAFREALRELLRVAPTGPGVPGGDGAPELAIAARRVLDAAGRAARLTLVTGADGQLSHAVAADGLAGALGQLLAVVVRAQHAGTWSRVRVCSNTACSWAFYDASRNRSGRWCSMSSCGNRLKVRAYRSRRSSGGSEPAAANRSKNQGGLDQ